MSDTPVKSVTCPKCGAVCTTVKETIAHIGTSDRFSCLEHVKRDLARVSADLAAANAERDQARRTAEYWKAEHLSGNALLEAADARAEEYKRDAERLDLLEQAIMDGSHESIWQDIVFCAEDAYEKFGRFPALRTCIDGLMPRTAIDAARKDVPGREVRDPNFVTVMDAAIAAKEKP